MNAPSLPAVGGRYARYVLAVLVFVYMFNFLDRVILAILAERIKGDLRLTDAQLGTLYGTAFAVCYALFGIPLGRLADLTDRRKLIAAGLTVWSVMTALSGFCRSFGTLAAARVGVAVGEASATPAGFSLLSDWFPKAQRATVLALYSGGLHLGGALGLLVGGQIVDRWDHAFTDQPAPWGLRGWQVAFLAVGLPGLLLAVLVGRLREPPRGYADGIAVPPHPHPLRAFGRELSSVLPPATVWRLWRNGGGRADVLANLATGLSLGLGSWCLVRWLGDPMQWAALALGIYGAVSWAQHLRRSDPPCFSLLLRTPALRFAILHFALLSFTGYGVGFWITPYFVRVLRVTEGQLGLALGLIAAAAGFAGAALGGLLGDRWRRRHPAGRLFVGMLAATLPVPTGLWLFSTESRTLAYLLSFPLILCSSMWIGCGASTVQDFVLPRMRATASAAYLLVLTLVGLALGPFIIGRVSLGLQDLRAGILCGFLANPLALLLALLAARHVRADEASLRQRAQVAGEPTDGP